MKKYIYKGSSTLSFTYDDCDYHVHGEGPHNLPEKAAPVQSSVGLLLLIEQEDKTKITIQKTEQDGK